MQAFTGLHQCAVWGGAGGGTITQSVCNLRNENVPGMKHTTAITIHDMPQRQAILVKRPVKILQNNTRITVNQKATDYYCVF